MSEYTQTRTMAIGSEQIGEIANAIMNSAEWLCLMVHHRMDLSFFCTFANSQAVSRIRITADDPDVVESTLNSIDTAHNMTLSNIANSSLNLDFNSLYAEGIQFWLCG